MTTQQMADLNRALAVALDHSNGNAQALVFHLTAPLAGWMCQGLLDQNITTAVIKLLHQLHPDIKI
jgi:hypothetical protein